MWLVLLIVIAVCALLALGGLVICITGTSFISDLSFVILHRFPDEFKDKAKEFREQKIAPSVGMSGGSVIYSGSIEMTYVGSEKWDSVVVVYLPSPVAARQLITRLGHVEREFKKAALQQLYGQEGNNSEELDGFDGVVHPIFAQPPILTFIHNIILNKLAFLWHEKQNKIRREQNRKSDEQDIDPQAGSNPIRSFESSYLLPSVEQKHEFLNRFNNSRPVNLISFVEVKSGKFKQEFMFAMKIGLACLGHVGAFVHYQSLFQFQSSWSYFSLIGFPNGGDSMLSMEDLKDYHDAFSYREESTASMLQFISINDKESKHEKRESTLDV